ncbi:hypothetical protein DB347_25180 [Opitutaceae bacterium EW11]|nr:hypothetical protein DB347_25180 [Opitutaceae bacterium EW11]
MTDLPGRTERAEIVHERPPSGTCDELLFGSDRGNTLWVKFSDRHGIVEWIGKFGCGTSSAMRVTLAAPPDRFIVAAGGYAYLVDATRRILLNEFHDQFAQDVAFEPTRNAFVVADYVRIRLVEAGKVTWMSPRIALDGIRNLKVEGQTIRGLAVTGYEGEEEEFIVDLDSREVRCPTDYSSWDKPAEAVNATPSSRPAKAKPWWRFW